MHPALRPYFQHVWPLFWPWLVWNLLRFARWYERTGIEALLAVDRFGNIRITHMPDAPPPDDLYTYDAPELFPWERLAPGFALPEGALEGLAVYRVFIVCILSAPAPLAEIAPHVRGPPWSARHSPQTPAKLPKMRNRSTGSISHLRQTGRPPPIRPHVLGTPDLPRPL